MSAPKFGLFVPLTSKPEQSASVEQFLHQGYTLVQEEAETLQWFAVKYDTPVGTQFAIVDTFAAESGRAAHLNGPIAAALMANKDTLLVPGDEGVTISPVEILASKVKPTATGKGGVTGGLKNGLRVLIKAKPEKVTQVKEFLTGALPLVEAEADTLIWYAIAFPGTNQFGIVDFFPSDEGRHAHLAGKVAAALFANVDELLVGPPDVVKVDVLAAKV